MRTVIVTVGQRASGKSTFCEKAILLDPSLLCISRDKILTQLFGKTSLDPYTGGHIYAAECMWKLVKEHLDASSDITMILDAWNGSSEDRARIIRKLKKFRVDRIEAWYFVTPVEHVDKWFWAKPGIAKIGEMKTRKDEGLVFFLENAPTNDYEVFHELAAKIDTDGFDEVIRINPVCVGPEHVLKLQNSLAL